MNAKVNTFFVLLSVLILFSHGLYGQNRKLDLHVIDSLTQIPIGYASISAKAHYSYVDCDENGKAGIWVATFDTLEISRVGYLKKSIVVGPHMGSLVVLLAPYVDTLLPVIIRPMAGNWVQSNLKNRVCRTINFSNDSVMSQVAVKVTLPTDAKGMVINTILFKQRNIADKFLRLHFYKENEYGLPGQELLKEVVIVNASHFKNGIVRISLDSMNLFVEGRSFFVALQWLTKLEPFSISRKNDIGLAETCDENQAVTYYQNFGADRNWHQLFSNGILIFKPHSNEVFERKLNSAQTIGKPFNLMLEVGGRLF